MNYKSILQRLLLLPGLTIGFNFIGIAKFDSSVLASAVTPNSYENAEHSIYNKKLLAQTVECAEYLDCNFQSCDRIGSDVVCQMLLTANQSTEIEVDRSTRAFDRFGNEYYVAEIALGSSNSRNTNRTNGAVTNDVIQGIGIKFEVMFKDIPSEIQQFTALDIALENGKIVLRDIPIN